jgi:hypothetical protein
VSKITHVIDLQVNLGGVWHPVSVTVPGRVASGIRSRDWEVRKRAFGYLFYRFKGKLATQLGMPAIPFRTEDQISVLNIQVLSRVKDGASKSPSKHSRKRSKVHPDQLTLADLAHWPGDV